MTERCCTRDAARDLATAVHDSPTAVGKARPERGEIASAACPRGG
ncbi:MAG TPA: hypothetical protein VLX92_05615 [Kofleriaceae bacterium]|nr:hypothetical protein [Kofleriaceae bacterium]